MGEGRRRPDRQTKWPCLWHNPRAVWRRPPRPRQNATKETKSPKDVEPVVTASPGTTVNKKVVNRGNEGPWGQARLPLENLKHRQKPQTVER